MENPGDIQQLKGLFKDHIIKILMVIVMIILIVFNILYFEFFIPMKFREIKDNINIAINFEGFPAKKINDDIK